MTRITKDEAGKRLDAIGHRNEAAELKHWRSSRGNNWGWDGWLRGQYPSLIDAVWIRR